MDIKARKLAFIEEFLKIESEKLISLFEKIMKDTKETTAEKEIVAYTVQGEPLTKEQYIERVKKASLGELTSVEDLEKEMQSW
jgi:hypothetical protein